MASQLFRVEPVWKRWRYMFDDGNTIDVESPYNSNSYDRELVLLEAAVRWGKREGRKIVGAASLDPLPEPPPTTKRRPKATP